jgi:ABC-type enterobactin transport system permease subunit
MVKQSLSTSRRLRTIPGAVCGEPKLSVFCVSVNDMRLFTVLIAVAAIAGLAVAAGPTGTYKAHGPPLMKAAAIWR